MWALDYWIYLERRIQLGDMHDELERQTYNLFPERWGQLYREEMLPGMPGDMGEAFPGGEKELPVTDYDSLNDWYNGLSAKRGISGEQAIANTSSRPIYSSDPIAVLGYAEGEGRRV